MDDAGEKGLNMKWEKKGLIFRPNPSYDWMVSHASLPTPIHIESDIYRVYFSSRDESNRSHIGYVEVDINQPDKILHLSKAPALMPGPLGNFDDHGVYVGSILTHNKKIYLYYTGWNPGKDRPLFYASIGLAISKDGGKTFQRFSNAPILARSEHDPCSAMTPFVMIEGSVWRMWYVSGMKWEIVNERMQSYYNIKYAESRDGVKWDRRGVVCIDFIGKNETNIGHPWITKESNFYRMWYSYNRGKGYRIGYAESRDGVKWDRKDNKAGIYISKSGWDSEAIEHPRVFEHKGVKYMLYCGNNFGREGFGLAVAV
jgi:predicted GH43/DUF377 family glycosyl hydrolase